MIKKFENFNNKKVIFFHGLGGSPSAERQSILENYGYDVVYPFIDYDLEWEKDHCKSLFYRSVESARDCDLIIGISLGGYLGHLVANLLEKDCILINPALDRSKTRLQIKNFDCPVLFNNCNLEVYLGDKDTLINKEYTIDFINDNNIKCKIHSLENMEHRCSLNDFLEILNKSNLVD